MTKTPNMREQRTEQTGHTPNPEYVPENSIQPTPTPWRIVRTPQAFRIFSQPIGENKQGVEIAATYLAGLDDKINAERIVSCVNALAGIQNPAAIKQLLSFAKVILDQIDGSKPNQMIGSIFDGREIAGLREAIKEMS